jgi:gamma-glutamylcysteine synthetase
MYNVTLRHVRVTVVVVVEEQEIFLISNFRLFLYVVCFLLGNSPASEFYMSTFRNTLSVPSS